MELLLASYQKYWLLDLLVAHVCSCHTVAILDVAHGSVQQPDPNPVAAQTCRSQSHFFSLLTHETTVS